jgi:hypothetical protein
LKEATMSAYPGADRWSETWSRENVRAGGETEAARANGRKPLAPQSNQYTVAPTSPGVNDQALVERLGRSGNIEILRTIAAGASAGPPVAVVRMTAEQAARLRQSAGDLLVERDAPLQLAAAATATPFTCASAIAYALAAVLPRRFKC